MGFLCKHNWVVISDRETLSQQEKLTKMNPARVHRLFRHETFGTIVTICACSKCGKIKKFVTKV